jgi:anti-sigma regulatory factor (Ser/Thr protein kinase)
LTEYLLKYKGTLNSSFSSELTESILDSLKSVVVSLKDHKKISVIALELIDNALRYGLMKEIAFTIRREDDILWMEMTNFAKCDDAKKLKDSSDRIQNLTAEEIELAFNVQLLNPEFGERGGAGLGLLHIARKGVIAIDVKTEKTDTDCCKCHIVVKRKISERNERIEDK